MKKWEHREVRKPTVLAWAVITKSHKLGVLNSKIYFSQFRRLGSPRSRCWLIWFLVKALFLACRQLPSHCPYLVQRESRREQEEEHSGVSSSS